MNENSSIFTTNYTLSLLMPVMLLGRDALWLQADILIWTPVLLVSIHYFYRYIPVNQGYDIQLAITSSSYPSSRLWWSICRCCRPASVP